MKPISVTSFRDHVQQCMQKETEALRLSTRYSHMCCVLQTGISFYKHFNNFFLSDLGSDPLASHEVSKLPFNRVKNWFANIFPCKYFGLLCDVHSPPAMWLGGK